MLATGSAVNELAQSSSASEGYIMEFAARLAGVGRQAGLTQAEVMGFASVGCFDIIDDTGYICVHCW